jgi:hypothetical protein
LNSATISGLAASAFAALAIETAGTAVAAVKPAASNARAFRQLDVDGLVVFSESAIGHFLPCVRWSGPSGKLSLPLGLLFC